MLTEINNFSGNWNSTVIEMAIDWIKNWIINQSINQSYRHRQEDKPNFIERDSFFHISPYRSLQDNESKSINTAQQTKNTIKHSIQATANIVNQFGTTALDQTSIMYHFPFLPDWFHGLSRTI